MGAAAFVLWATTATFAQGKTDFSGTWNRDMPAAGAAGAGGGGGGGGQRGGGGGGRGGGFGGGAFNCGATCSITQSGNTITLTRTQGEATIKHTFVVDGKTVNKNENPARQGGAPTVVESTAKWDGAKVVITRTMDMQGTAVTLTQTLSIEGGKLTIVSTSSMAEAPSTTATYTKG